MADVPPQKRGGTHICQIIQFYVVYTWTISLKRFFGHWKG